MPLSYAVDIPLRRGPLYETMSSPAQTTLGDAEHNVQDLFFHLFFRLWTRHVL